MDFVGVMKNAVTGLGLAPDAAMVTFPIDMFLLMGDNYIGDDDLGRACHAKRKAFELNLARAGKSALKREIYKNLARLGVGRDVFVVARKPA